MPIAQFIKGLLIEDKSSSSRSNIHKSIFSMMSVTIGATIVSSYINAPEWLTVMCAGFSSITFIVFIFSFVYLLFKDPDLLRSEELSYRKLDHDIRKFAIESGIANYPIATPDKFEIRLHQESPQPHVQELQEMQEALRKGDI